MSTPARTNRGGGVTTTTGRVNLYSPERDVLAWLYNRTAATGDTTVKAHHYPGEDLTPTRVGKAIARLKRHDRTPLQIERWNRSTNSSTTWVVTRR